MPFPLSRPSLFNPGQHVRKRLGQSYLHANRLEEAIQVFLEILVEDPTDVDALLVMANLYRTSGSAQMALHLYKQAWRLDPGNLYIQKKLASLKECASTEFEETQPFLPAAVTRLLERLHCQERVGLTDEIRAAADMLDRFISSHPARLDVQHLMPAFIEWNMRHARAAGQTDLAETLQSLHNHLSRQLMDAPIRLPEQDNSGG